MNPDLENIPDTGFHHFFKLTHPVFHIFLIRIHSFYEINFFFLRGKHSDNFFIRIKFDFVNVFKYFLQMWLDLRRLLGFGKNFQQLVIREEIKSRKFFSFRFQILVEFFLNMLKVFIELPESITKSFLGADREHVLLREGVVHGIFPTSVYSPKGETFLPLFTVFG